MRVLKPVVPTPEQLQILGSDTFSVTVIRGAAGSGKTTSAALRSRKVLAGVAAQRYLDGDRAPIRMLVLTFNRTLKGYIEQLIVNEAAGFGNVEITIDTFAAWACGLVGYHEVVGDDVREAFIKARWREAAPKSVLSERLMPNEVAYVLGRFGRADLESYIGCRRAGRGSPALLPATRRTILDEVIAPYLKMLDARGIIDWSDYARLLLEMGRWDVYDIVIADEVQDFGVQQVRAIMSTTKPRASVTFIIDNGQSIYPQVMHWDEVPLTLNPATTFELRNNYRNTAQIAEFVQPLLQGMPLTADGAVPDFRNCRNNEIGRTPELLQGRFSSQVAYAVREIRGFPGDETVGILTPWGDSRGEIVRQLDAARIPWVTLTQQKDWPHGTELVAVSTLHSAKGLEFDHVFVLGFDREFLTPYDDANPDATAYLEQRRLLAMALTRAKRSVFIGYRVAHRSDILDLLDPARYIEREV